MEPRTLQEKLYVEMVAKLFIKGYLDLSLTEVVTEESRDRYLRNAYEASRRAAEVYQESEATLGIEVNDG